MSDQASLQRPQTGSTFEEAAFDYATESLRFLGVHPDKARMELLSPIPNRPGEQTEEIPVNVQFSPSYDLANVYLVEFYLKLSNSHPPAWVLVKKFTVRKIRTEKYRFEIRNNGKEVFMVK